MDVGEYEVKVGPKANCAWKGDAKTVKVSVVPANINAANSKTKLNTPILEGGFKKPVWQRPWIGGGCKTR